MERHVESTNFEELKSRTWTDLQRIANLFRPPGRSSFTHRAIGPLRTDDSEDPFEKELCKFFRQRGLELLRASFADLRRSGGIHDLSQRAKLADEIYGFLRNAWQGLGSTPLIWQLRDEDVAGFCGVRQILYDEVKGHYDTAIVNDGGPGIGQGTEPVVNDARSRANPNPTEPPPTFPDRAAWFRNVLAVRKSSPYKFSLAISVDVKTLKKILDGQPVRNDALCRLAQVLKISVSDIPNT